MGLDVAIGLHARPRRDQLPDDDVLLEAHQGVAAALDGQAKNLSNTENDYKSQHL